MRPFSERACRLLAALALASLWSATLPSTRGQQPQQPTNVADLERRVRELEDEIRQLKADRQGSTPPASSPAATEPSSATSDTASGQGGSSSASGGGSSGLSPEAGRESGKGESGSGSGQRTPSGSAGWNEGFFIQSKDKDYALRITGQIQGDYRAFLNEKDQVDMDTFLLRRARLGIEADMFKYYEFRLLPDFGQGQAIVQDAYMNVHYIDEFQVEVGRFKQPVSYEQLIQDRFVPTVERSLIDQLTPQRDLGFMLHGEKLLGDRLDWFLAVSNGEINGNTVDPNEHKDLNGRVAVRPFNAPEVWPVLHGLQVGVSGGWGVEQEVPEPAVLRTPATVQWFAFNPGVRADGVRTRLTPEVAYFYHSLGFAAQYYHEEEKLRPTASTPFTEDVPFSGFYVMSTYFLTGEERTQYSQPIYPLRPFDPCNFWSCPGAWELVARVSHLEVTPEVFTPGAGNLADPTKFSNAATETTLGFNWYLNRWFRMQFNWEHAWFDAPVVLGGPPFKTQDSLLTRLQIIF